MASGLKKLLLTTSSLVGFVLVPEASFADPVSASIIVSSAISAGVGTLATVGFSGFTLSAFATKFAVHAVSGFVLNALTPKPNMPNFSNLSSLSGSTSQGTATVGGYNVSGIASAAEHQVIYGQTKVGGVIVFKEVTTITYKGKIK